MHDSQIILIFRLFAPTDSSKKNSYNKINVMNPLSYSPLNVYSLPYYSLIIPFYNF